MIDYIALTLAHGLLIIALFRIVQDDALDPVKAPLRRARKNGQDDSAKDSKLAAETTESDPS